MPAFGSGCECPQKEATDCCGIALLAFAVVVAVAPAVASALVAAVAVVVWQWELRPGIASLVEVQAWWIYLEARSCPIAQRHERGTDNHRPGRLLSLFDRRSDWAKTLRSPKTPYRLRSGSERIGMDVPVVEDMSSW